MGINKQEELANGVQLGYWRITSLNTVVNVQTVIELTGYTSQDKRAEEQASIEDPSDGCDVYIETRYLVVDYDPNMSVTKAYEYLKSLPEFADGEDVIEGWSSGSAYFIGDVVSYGSLLWQCIQSHTAQEGWEPPNSPSLWGPYDSGEIPEWYQPDSTNPYMKGDKVKHNGKIWESTMDYNVFEPGVAGWIEVNE